MRRGSRRRERAETKHVAVEEEKDEEPRPPPCEQEKHNFLAVGKWDVRHKDCESLEICKGVKELQGEAIVGHCSVTLECSDTMGKTMEFVAIVHGKGANFSGQMHITVQNPNRLHLVFQNGRTGAARIGFEGLGTRGV